MIGSSPIGQEANQPHTTDESYTAVIIYLTYGGKIHKYTMASQLG